MSHGYTLYCLRSRGASFWSSAAVLRMIWLPLVATALILFLRAAGLAPLERGYDLMRYLDLRSSEAILLLASALPCSITVICHRADRVADERSSSLILSSAILSIAAFVILLFVINRQIFNG